MVYIIIYSNLFHIHFTLFRRVGIHTFIRHILIISILSAFVLFHPHPLILMPSLILIHISPMAKRKYVIMFYNCNFTQFECTGWLVLLISFILKNYAEKIRFVCELWILNRFSDLSNIDVLYALARFRLSFITIFSIPLPYIVIFFYYLDIYFKKHIIFKDVLSSLHYFFKSSLFSNFVIEY